MKTCGFHIILSLVLLYAVPALSQTAIQQFTAVYVPDNGSSSYSAKPATGGNFSDCSNTSFTYSWGNGSDNLLRLNSFSVNSKTYIISPQPGSSVKLRRINNANVTGKRTILYSEITTSPASACPGNRTLTFRAPYQDTMELELNNNILNHGTDNIFTNTGNGDNNNNNIERVDVIIPLGVYTSFVNDAGFGLFERGSNNAHDGVRIAAILSLDVNGDPASFGAVKTCVPGNGSNNSSWGHPSIANGNHAVSAYVLRKDEADTRLRVSSTVNQELGGVFFSFADLGIGFNQKIYGYSLIGPDGKSNPSSAELLNLNNTTVYPTSTTEGDGGGLDLICVNTYFGTNQALADMGTQSFRGESLGVVNHLQWSLPEWNEQNRIDIQRSVDGSVYQNIFTYYTGTDHDPVGHDDTPGSGIHFYRLCITLPDGSTQTSRVISLTGDQVPEFKAGPNPVLAGNNLLISGLLPGTYHAFFTSMNGNREYQIGFKVNGNSQPIRVPEGIKTGFYLLQLENQSLKWVKPYKLMVKGR
jgi:hypothetical protein